MYEEDYHHKVHKNLLENQAYYIFRSRCADKYYLKHLNGKILDFGCGIGQNIFLHKENSFGMDISEFAINECKKRGIKTIKDIKKIDDLSFNGILCAHVLEHLKNPHEIVSQFYRILTPSGKIVIVLPFSKDNKPVKHFKSDIAKHFYSWDFGSINEMIGDIGFKIKLNKFNYGYGYSKFYKLPFSIANLLLKVAGIIFNKKERIIVAEK